ncbi:MAG: hypothetical protein DRH03_06920 [Deltaproteobacteria bacterium]|nr:MAG: hypothetical protein DRH03_06920 [Deltaproteobacteria bacterium]
MKSRISIGFLFLLLLILSACVPSQEMNSARQSYQSGKIEEAYSKYQAILKKEPGNQEALTALGKIKNDLVNRAMSQAQAECNSTPTIQIESLHKAIAILTQVYPYNPQSSALEANTQRYKTQLKELQEANLLRAEQFHLALKSDKFGVALQNLQEIEKTNPTLSNLKTLKDEYRLSYGTYLEKEIASAVANNNFKKAHHDLTEWQALGLSGDVGAKLESLLRSAEAKQIKQELNILIARHKFYTAYLLILANGYSNELAQEVENIRTAGTQFYLEQATKRLAQGDISRAYIETVKGYELDRENPAIFDLHRDTRDQILRQLQRYIAIPLFGAPRDQPDLGPQLSDALISYLFRVLPYGINIVERGKIDLLLEEQKREYKKVGNLLNVDMIITGNISLLNIDRQESEHLVTVKAKTGEKTISNPEYEAWLRLPLTSREGTPQPRKLLVMPTYQNFTYKKGTVRLKGFTSVSLRIFDTTKGSVTYAQEFNANYSVSDDFQDEVQLANVESDPLDLPSNTEIREKLRNKVIKQIAGVISKQFDKRESNFLQDANYFLSRHENDKALQKLAQGFLYCIKAKVKADDPDFRTIRDKIIKLTETGFIDDGAMQAAPKAG